MQACAHCHTPHGLGISFECFGSWNEVMTIKESVAAPARLEYPFLLVVHLGEVGGCMGTRRGRGKEGSKGGVVLHVRFRECSP